MGRLVEHDANGPYRLDESDVDPEKGDVAVCLCGLSGEYPLCDGSHRQTETEAEDGCYRYVREEGDLRRREVAEIHYAGEDASGADPEDGTDEA